MTGKKYCSGNWFNRALGAGIFLGAGLIANGVYADINTNNKQDSKSNEEKVDTLKIQQEIQQDSLSLDSLVVLFDFNSDKLDSTNQALIKDRLNNLEVESLNIIGYACTSGDSDYNLNLSKRRAENVNKFIKSISNSSRINVSYKGETSERGRNPNRAVVVQFKISNKTLKKEELEERLQKDKNLGSISLGTSGFASNDAYGLDFVLDISEEIYGMNHSEGNVSWLLHFGASHDKVRKDSYENRPLGRNQRYLHQEREVKTDGLIPRVGVGVSLTYYDSGIGGELSVIKELSRNCIERINEEIRNPGGSLYRVEENYVKYTKGKPRTLLYSGVRCPLDEKRNWHVRAGIQFGDEIKPQFSAGISKSIWLKQKK